MKFCEMKRLKNISAGWLSFLLIIACIFSCNKGETQVTNLVVSPDSLVFLAEGGNGEIQITCDATWTVSDKSDWINMPSRSSEGNGKVTFIISANQTATDRSATITVNAEELTKDVVILQKGSTTPVDNSTTSTDSISSDSSYDATPDPTKMGNLTPAEYSKKMGVGWNIGNSLDAINGETSWGNPLITQTLIDSVKAAGFNTIRIPIAWSKFSDQQSFTIEESFMERVDEVVNYVLKNDMYAMINIHWDGGWIQPTFAQQEYVNNRLSIMWEQIATYFRDYDDHLLFAGTNEIMVEGQYGTPSKENYTVQNSYNQTFVTTVRSTGGRNAYRRLVIQGYNTNIDHTVNYTTIPKDIISNHLMMEVHYYDPYNFALNENSSVTQWGKIATDPKKTETWANETYADNQFNKMKINFVDKNIPVILGEYGAISRTDVADHSTYREYYTKYLTKSMIEHGLVPVYWDNGSTGNHSFGLFNRSTGQQAYPAIIKAITGAEK